MALYEISPKIVHFALSRHQERNLKIRSHTMKDNMNAVILIPKLRKSDYPRDLSNWRKIRGWKFQNRFIHAKLRGRDLIFRPSPIIRTCSFTWIKIKFRRLYKFPVLFLPRANEITTKVGSTRRLLKFHRAIRWEFGWKLGSDLFVNVSVHFLMSSNIEMHVLVPETRHKRSLEDCWLSGRILYVV